MVGLIGSFDWEQVYSTADGTRHRFFMVWNYVRQLRRWVRHIQNPNSSSGVLPPLLKARSESRYHVIYSECLRKAAEEVGETYPEPPGALASLSRVR